MNTQRLRSIFAITLLGLDATMLTLAFIAAYYIRVVLGFPEPLETNPQLASYSGLMIAQVASIMIALFFSGQYVIQRAESRIDQFYSAFAASSIGTIVAIAASTFLFKNNSLEVDYPRAMIVFAWLLSILALATGRGLHQLFRSTLRSRGLGQDNLLIVGTDETARLIAQRVTWSPLGYKLLGIVDDNASVSELSGVPVIGTPEDLPRLIDELQIDEVIIAMPEKGHRETVRVISYCERGRVSIKVYPDIFQIIATEANIDDLGGLPLLSIRDFAMRGYTLAFKRVIDVTGSLFGLVITSPVMILLGLLIKLESPGPVFFIQERMGLDGKPFKMLKFRSMRSDAESAGPGWTTDNDPRQTKLGTFLRRIDLDELPNLINVLLGEMSLVGPRPEQPHYVELFRESVPGYMERHREKSGMTGWAQVNGLRGDTSIDERTKYDLWYSENWSILLDLKILVRTTYQLVLARRPRLA